MSALAVDALASGTEITAKTVGIVGCGNVGSRLRKKLQDLGVKTLVNDPPLQDAGIDGLVSLEQVLQADVISLHVPLIQQGPYATRHLLDSGRIARLKPGALLINSCRGEVVESQALKTALKQGRLRAALDVWENEPDIDRELMQLAQIATPHIAGYSLEGKMRGTAMIYRSLCDHLGIGADKRLQHFLPAPQTRRLSVQDMKSGDQLSHLLLCCYDIEEDSRRMRRALAKDSSETGSEFDRLRKTYPVRRESAMQRLDAAGLNREIRQYTSKLVLELLG